MVGIIISSRLKYYITNHDWTILCLDMKLIIAFPVTCIFDKATERLLRRLCRQESDSFVRSRVVLGIVPFGGTGVSITKTLGSVLLVELWEWAASSQGKIGNYPHIPRSPQDIQSAKGQQGSDASGFSKSIVVRAKQPRHDSNREHSAHAPFLNFWFAQLVSTWFSLILCQISGRGSFAAFPKVNRGGQNMQGLTLPLVWIYNECRAAHPFTSGIVIPLSELLREKLCFTERFQTNGSS